MKVAETGDFKLIAQKSGLRRDLFLAHDLKKGRQVCNSEVRSIALDDSSSFKREETARRMACC